MHPTLHILTTTATAFTARAAVFIGTAAVAGAALTGCTAAPAAPANTGCAAPAAVALVIAVHANATPGIPAEASCSLDKAMETNAPISVIAEDGRPYTVQAKHLYNLDPHADTYPEDLNKARIGLITTVSTAQARTDGDDTLAAVSLAADLLHGTATSTTRPVLIMLTPGLPDTAPLDYTQPSLASADPAEVLTRLQGLKAEPKLPDTDVLWAGAGAASGTQEPLPQGQRDNYQGIWTAILAGAGAKTVFIPGPVSGGSAPHNNGHTIRPVPPVQQTPIAIAPDTTEIFTNSSVFGFLPDSNTFRDQPAAQKAAARIATWLTAGAGRTADITGTTATAGTEQTRHALSLARANAVAALITAAGAPATTLTTTGAGTHFPAFTPDTDPNGTLDPAKAETNRTVQIHYTTHQNTP